MEKGTDFRFVMVFLAVFMLAAVGANQTSGKMVGFQGLGDLEGGSSYSLANGISADGTVVVGKSKSASGTEAFLWSAAVPVLQGLGDIPGVHFGSNAMNVSPDGSVIVGNGTNETTSMIYDEAFRWMQSEGMQGLGIPSVNGLFSHAEAASANGAVIVGDGARTVNNQPVYEAYSWTAEHGMQGLGDLSGGVFSSGAWDVSADGSVIVGQGTSASGPEAFRWTASDGMMHGLGDLAGGEFWSMASGVSADGSVVVGYSKSGSSTLFEAFRWSSTNGMMEALGDLPGGDFNSAAHDVSADGSVVVGSGKTELGFEAFVWDEIHHMRNLREVLANDCGLDMTGWLLTSATGISADGLTIVGYGTNPIGNTEAWIATIPEPCTLALLALGWIPAVCRRHRART
jgi:probable HAF family extracellular repeat protein